MKRFFNSRSLLSGLICGVVLAFAVAQTAHAQKMGGTLIVGKPTDPQSLDPQRDAGGPSGEVHDIVLEPLVFFDDQNTLQPLLATSWEVSDDGLTYTFQLRKGVKFHDGTDFNAQAMKYVFDRSMGKIGEKKNRYISLIRPLEQADAVGEHTLRLKLKTRLAPFLNSMVHTGFAALSPTAIEKMGAGFGKAPVGTGPFKITAWEKGQRIELSKNTNYWQSGRPYLDKIEYRILPDAQTRVAALKAGEVDFVILLPENLYSNVANTAGLKVVKTQTLRTIFFRFNPTIPPFDDINVRKAFVHSIDNKAILGSVLEGLHFEATQPTQPLAVWGIAKDIQPYRHDPELSAQALRASGWSKQGGTWSKNGQPLQFKFWTTANRYPQDENIGVAVKNMLSQSGLRVEVGTREWGAYRDSIFNKEFSAFLFGAGVSTGDVDFVYHILFHGSTRYAQGPSKADALLEAARMETNPAKRLALSRQFQQVVRDEYLWMPVYWMSQLVAMSDKVKGFKGRADEGFDFTRVWVE